MASTTLHDIARRAGVHYSTASRVLNGAGRVSPETRERILQAAAELDFVPNAQARLFKRGASQIAGVVTQFAGGTFSLPVLGGASLAFGSADVAMLHYDADGDPKTLDEIVLRMRSRQAEGVLVVGDGPERALKSLTEVLRVPVAYAYAVTDSASDACFTTDGVGAGRLAADHLLSQGRRRLVHITSAHSLAAADRFTGFRDRVLEAGIELTLDEPLAGTWTREWGASAARELLERGVAIDGIFCGNDEIAYGVETVLAEHGIRIPDDVAIVGHDNSGGHFGGWADRISTTTHHLTTIDPMLAEIGRVAASAVVSATTGGAELPPGRHTVPSVLVPGVSSGARARS